MDTRTKLKALVTILGSALLLLATPSSQTEVGENELNAELQAQSLQLGYASWYGDPFHGERTTNGEIYDMNGLTAAHREAPLGSYAIVTNLSNGLHIKVRINDRGPYVDNANRIIDLSRRAATLLKFKNDGLTRVAVRLIDAQGAPIPFKSLGFTLQLASLTSEAAAQQEFNKFAKRLGDQQLYLRSRGDHWTVSSGFYRDRDNAVSAIHNLRHRGISAIIAEIYRSELNATLQDQLAASDTAATAAPRS